jgi:hypothetical protein
MLRPFRRPSSLGVNSTLSTIVCEAFSEVTMRTRLSVGLVTIVIVCLNVKVASTAFLNFFYPAQRYAALV